MPGLTLTQFRARKDEFIGKMLNIEATDEQGPIKFRGKIESINPAHFTGFVISLKDSEAKRKGESSFSRCNKLNLVLKMYGWSLFWLEDDGTVIFPKDTTDHQPDFEYRRIIISP